MPRRSTPAVTVFFLKVGNHAVPNQEVVEPAAHQSGITNLQGISGTVVRFFAVHQAGLPVSALRRWLRPTLFTGEHAGDAPDVHRSRIIYDGESAIEPVSCPTNNAHDEAER